MSAATVGEAPPPAISPAVADPLAGVHDTEQVRAVSPSAAGTQQFDDAQDFLGARMLENLKTSLGEAWEHKLSPAERDMVVATMNDLAAMTLLGVITGKGLDAERQQLIAQLANVTAIETVRFQHYVEVAAGRAALTGIKWLVAAASPYLL